MSWTSSLEAARHRDRKDPTSRYAQLATVDADGWPHCRTVVVRRVEGTAIDFVTDARSDKITHLEHQPRAELCWYFRDARAQFRLAGRIRRVDPAPLWEAMSEGGRRSFVWPPPGAPRAADDAFDVAPPSSPPPTFVALRLETDEVDLLELRPSPHRRRRYRRQESWQVEELNP